jgi:hypothetical protein
MKNLIKYISVVLVGAVFSCQPIDDRELEALAPKSDLKFSVTQTQGYDNQVILESQTAGALPYWEYASGSSNKLKDTVIFPFAGEFEVTYSVFGAGGRTTADPYKITVSKNDPVYFPDPKWNFLTNGVEGKTWVLDMTKPQGWYGFDYGKDSGANWSWHPDYKGNEWLMENKDWGEMTFDLNGGGNYSRTMYDNSGNPVNCNGSFSMDLAAGKIKLIGCDMLYGGDPNNFPDKKNLKILQLDANVMILGVVSATKPEYYGFRFIPKP